MNKANSYMSKRTALLSAIMGLLVLSAAQMKLAYESRATHGSAVSPSSSTEAEATCRKKALVSELLSASYATTNTPALQPGLVPADVDTSTLWLARAVYSETKLPHEQELVAWVIRNRVESGFRGKTSYQSVVLDPYQFSAFNPGSPKRSFLLHLTPDTELSGWQQALWVAHYVRHADPAYRPFSVETRHFYSEQSMNGQSIPYWADRYRFVSPGWNFTLNERRFRFYEKIS